MSTRTFSLILLATSLTAGCGGDDPKPPPPTGKRTAQPAAPSGARGAAATAAGVVNYRRVEDRAGDERERKAIRVTLTERDFTPDITGNDNRDPFRSFVVAQPGVGTGSGPPVEATEQCPRKRQWARTYSARELKLVGIVARGTIRHALFSDPAQVGWVIQAGDCIGKEKARVKQIGATFVTLEVSTEVAPNQPPRPAEERSIPLHPKDLTVGDETDEADDSGMAPPVRRPATNDDPAPTNPAGAPPPSRIPPATPPKNL
jgi:Tfp pilus assembly protein PilP